MVNDYQQPSPSEAGSSAAGAQSLLEQANYLVLLVSATPYNILSKDSRLPEKYMVVAEGQPASAAGLRICDVLERR